jgi:hypothetical protein
MPNLVTGQQDMEQVIKTQNVDLAQYKSPVSISHTVKICYTKFIIYNQQPSGM